IHGAGEQRSIAQTRRSRTRFWIDQSRAGIRGKQLELGELSKSAAELAAQLHSLRQFRWWCIDAAMAFPIAEIKDESDQQPDDQSHPIRPSETVDHRAAHND